MEVSLLSLGNINIWEEVTYWAISDYFLKLNVGFLFTLAIRSSYSTMMPPRILVGTFPLMSLPTKILVGIRPRHPRRGWRLCTFFSVDSGTDQPECTTCQCPLTVKHILVECSDFNDTLNKHFVASSTEELFRTADVYNILDFTKETHFFTASYDVYKHFIVAI